MRLFNIVLQYLVTNIIHIQNVIKLNIINQKAINTLLVQYLIASLTCDMINGLNLYRTFPSTFHIVLCYMLLLTKSTNV